MRREGPEIAELKGEPIRRTSLRRFPSKGHVHEARITSYQLDGHNQ